MVTKLRPKDVAKRYNRSEKRVRQIARESTAHHRRHERWVWEGWEDPELTPVLQRLENGRPSDKSEEWDLVISRKNQVTLPVASLAKLRVKPGDKLLAIVRGRSLVLLPHPPSWADYYAGIAEGMYGHTKEDIDAYLREVRGDWQPPLE